MSLEINKLLEIEREAEDRIKKAREEAEKLIEGGIWNEHV